MRVAQILVKLRVLYGALEAAAKHEFPPGTRITYDHGGCERQATVVDNSCDRIRVRGRTGTTYWLDVRRARRLPR